MRVNASHTSTLVKTELRVADFIVRALSSSLLVKLNRALLWYDELQTNLIKDGWFPDELDSDVFKKTLGTIQIAITIVDVDELLTHSKNPSLIRALMATLESKNEKL